MEFVTHLQYEYAQVAVDLFYENLTLLCHQQLTPFKKEVKHK